MCQNSDSLLPELLTAKDIARLLRISYESALCFIRCSGVDYIKIGRTYRVSKDKLMAFISAQGSKVIDDRGSVL